MRYTAVIGLLLLPPPAIGSVAVRHNLAAQLDAVAAGVARRSRPADTRPGDAEHQTGALAGAIAANRLARLGFRSGQALAKLLQREHILRLSPKLGHPLHAQAVTTPA